MVNESVKIPFQWRTFFDMHWYSVYPSILPGFPVDSLDDALLRGTAVEALDAALTLLDMRSLPCRQGRSWGSKIGPQQWKGHTWVVIE